jgi:asparagine synthase (glutamine-hydrolysing)
MSVQFGKWNFEGPPADCADATRAEEFLSPYAPDGMTVLNDGPLTLLFGAFHTTGESRRECQPYISPNDNIFMWDGRLDNRADCLSQLRMANAEVTDVEIVATAYEHWGLDSLSRLLGDWALSVWSPSNHSLVLARDFLGTRQLYYALENDHLTWSTILDPLVFLRRRPVAVSEEYVAGWLARYPKSTLSPYEGILAVPPASYVTIRPRKAIVKQYWKFNPERQTRHRTDREYEERFLSEFQQTLERRMRSDGPVLAELSGGMDSSSIVCVTDQLLSDSSLNLPRLDTVSYYDDSEPNWDERPFFTKVEERRGRIGFHIDASPAQPPAFACDDQRFLATPSSALTDSGFARQFSECIATGPYRVLLSGIGGDEVTGGVPTPVPELADLLTRLKFVRFSRQIVAWSLTKKKPISQLFSHVAGSFLPSTRPQPDSLPWLSADFVERQSEALRGYHERLNLFGPLPSFQANLFALEALQRQFGCTPLPLHPSFEKRYPYLDRDFLAFCYSLPREQLIRPGQRRSLMRRAMEGIVPHEIVNRKRKAFVRRRLATTLLETSRMLTHDPQDLVSATLGIIEPNAFLKAIHDAGCGSDAALVPLIRAVDLEQWLRSLLLPSSVGIQPSQKPARPHRYPQTTISRPRTIQTERR